MSEPTKTRTIMQMFDNMCSNQLRVEAMSTDELTTSLAGLELKSTEYMDSFESAVKGEALHRLKHPFSWRIIRWRDRMKRGSI